MEYEIITDDLNSLSTPFPLSDHSTTDRRIITTSTTLFGALMSARVRCAIES